MTTFRKKPIGIFWGVTFTLKFPNGFGNPFTFGGVNPWGKGFSNFGVLGSHTGKGFPPLWVGDLRLPQTWGEKFFGNFQLFLTFSSTPKFGGRNWEVFQFGQNFGGPFFPPPKVFKKTFPSLGKIWPELGVPANEIPPGFGKILFSTGGSLKVGPLA